MSTLPDETVWITHPDPPPSYDPTGPLMIPQLTEEDDYDVPQEPIYQPPPRLPTPSRGYTEPQPLPRTHGIPVALLHLRSYHIRLLDLFVHFSQHTAVSLGIPASGTRPLPSVRRLWTVPKSPFIYKSAQENFERITHKRVIKLWDANPAVLEVFFRYLEAHALAGVGMRTTRWDRAPLGFGGARLARAIQAGVGSKEQRQGWKQLKQEAFDPEDPHAAPVLVKKLVEKILREEERRDRGERMMQEREVRAVHAPTAASAVEEPANAATPAAPESSTVAVAPPESSPTAPTATPEVPANAATVTAQESTTVASSPEEAPPVPEPVAQQSTPTETASVAEEPANAATPTAAADQPQPQAEVVAASPAVSPQEAITESEVVARDEPIDGSAGTADVPPAEVGKKRLGKPPRRSESDE
ncbi:hypothetical protein CALCODRAFT_492309 [Calocera cornea HHB12733]|uniref:Small ribosomal subunit protein uS10 domain-containing protein n=1 Tax=Calocera cornea HHB12733 TaxID=1353952 RepID=A0A165IG59_9BASI|nr:hypothetical protein CALCODRAFT_492309 [Calocera cornea HHB12733]